MSRQSQYNLLKYALPACVAGVLLLHLLPFVTLQVALDASDHEATFGVPMPLEAILLYLIFGGMGALGGSGPDALAKARTVAFACVAISALQACMCILICRHACMHAYVRVSRRCSAWRPSG